MFIRQIINNNVVLVRDTGGKELIVVAKGIGYHGRTGAAVDLKRYPDHRLFVPDDAEHARIRQIYNEIPEDQFDLAVQLLQMEQQARGMDGSIPITAALMLADHLHEMVARLKNGLELHNALTNEITALCLTEFAAQGYSILFGYWWTACISVIGIALGALLVARNKEERSLALSCSLVAIFGGVSEPTLFSYLLRNKRYAIPMAIGGALGGGLAGNCFLFLFQANRPQLIMQIFRKQPASFLTCRLPFSTLFIVLKAADINAGAWAAIRITHRLPDRKTSLSTPDLPQVRRRHQPKYRGGARFARSFR